ncbi:FUN31 [Candida pseudojiufengensis]|uniref:FUN31 n=1 Tax=Candida pseudojiufengensis TaxID=497109 RepID=UPI00222541C6|nr:FUN31 [Candida pseudojiufengensis]KAI5961634.1 FUN31 [Candida pseudojiufengensis]
MTIPNNQRDNIKQEQDTNIENDNHMTSNNQEPEQKPSSYTQKSPSDLLDFENPIPQRPGLDIKIPSSAQFAPSPIPRSNSKGIFEQKDKFTEDILNFPIESSHAYSYAHLSPNSLALRLNVLKRSLEILKDRPDLFKSITNQNNDEITPINRSISIDESFSNQSTLKSNIFQHSNHSADFSESSPTTPLKDQKQQYKLQSNASSAALAALFRPKLQRSDSFPLETKELRKSSAPSKLQDVTNNEKKDDFRDILKLLENDLEISEDYDIASTIKDLTLFSTDEQHQIKHDILKKKLIYALAMPFIENSVLTSSLLGSDEQCLPSAKSSVSLKSLNKPSSNKRPFHSMLNTKYSLPQSVFTIESDLPWSVKAANDLACLMFGLSKQTIKSLTLMDLIAPQFRDFVLGKLTKYTFENIKKDNIIFAGEIVAIVRPGDKNYSWTSLWAKKKGNLIICMFDQIPCDAFDIIVNENNFKIEKINEVAGDFINDYDINTNNLKLLSETLNQDLLNDDNNLINHTRYYTLQVDKGNENLPCAITSVPLEGQIKLKIHTMPYIAGIFVLNASNFKILSCNNAIARNLFGRSIEELKDKSINEIIPNFTKILSVGIEENVNTLQVVNGLVLPEHFFRKYDSVLKYQNQTKLVETEEDIFFNSIGIEGKHRDGKSLFIDVQARVSAEDALIVWVTYSRSKQAKAIANELERLQSTNSSTMSLASEPKQTRLNELKKKRTRTNSNQLPSQLKLFDDEKENNLLEFSPREITRSSSTRRVKTKSYSMPVSYLENLNTYTSKKLNELKNDVESIDSKDITEEEIETNFKINFTEFSEEEILKLENDSLESIKLESTKWPSEVGLYRRSKKFSEFKILKQMGEGAYGKVVLAQHKEDPLYKIIIKCIDKERILVDTWVRDRKLGTIPSEIQIMSFLNSELHPNIMRIIDFFEDSKYYYLETPIFGNPPAIDLFDFIEIKKDLNEIECKFIFKQIVSSIYHLHKQGIIHRDIKDENIIVDEKGFIKLIDFGSAGYVKQGPFDVFVGTVDYASPEVLRGEKYEGKPQDIWALGILLYTMLYKENPYYSVDEIMEGELRIPYVISDSSVNLIKKILVRDVDKRPTITDILEDKWLQF